MIRLSVAVMAHRKRERFVAELLAKLDRPAEVVWDRKDDRWDTGRRAMLAYDRDTTHHAVVQDDAIVCRDLAAGVERALGHVPDGSPMGLYCGRNRPYRDLVQSLVEAAGPGTSWLTMSQLHWGVGIVMPTKHIDEMVAWCDSRPEITNYDRRISRWCQHRGLTVYYPWPSLVDHRNSPSLVPGRQSAGRRAHRFIGADRSALGWSAGGGVVSVPALNAREHASAAGQQIGAPPVKFVSMKYPDLHVPTVGVRFRPVETAIGRVGVADVTTRGAIAHLQSPWMRRRGVRPAEPEDLAPPAAETPTEAGAQPAEDGRRDSPPAPAPPPAGSPDGVPDGTAADVLAWVGEDRGRARQALTVEQARPKPRTSLVAKLDKIAGAVPAPTEVHT